MIYLDNAATSFPKPERVYEEISRCMREYCANPGRGGHAMSIASGKAVLLAREAVCRLFNLGNPLRVAFTKNATEALNIALKGTLKHGDHVITTCMEHNSVVRPLKTLEKDEVIEITVVKGDSYGCINPDDIKKAVRKNTALIVTTLSSNVNGTIMPAAATGKIAGEYEIPYLLDVSQGAGTLEVDAEKLNTGMIAFPGHKGLLGPQGTGGLFVREGFHLNNLMQGGTGSNSENLLQPEFMPDTLESGTLNTPGLVGLRYGIEFLENLGIKNVEYYKGQLISRLISGFEGIRNIRVYSLKDPGSNSGIAAINIDGMDSNDVSGILDKKYGIATRAGLHCSPFAHSTLGTMGVGVVRFSPGCFNTIEEIDKTLEAVEEIAYVSSH